ncbi:unnamed protein product [Soboliphyme baturini]|uniref:OxoGdeHyase_C domain-containing protein n=1 Tax=Soboliphyme baturini TaxID=241478 RepID=A0A183J0Q0_9BILA|nr:unnamed protein product [Soboliphyme baturini]
MGPEHSSGRLERYLQLCNDDEEKMTPVGPTFEAQQLYDTNMIVANCTKPASLFHILRRQIKMPFRKPLIVMTPKSLLRHPDARSPLSDYAEGTSFQRVLPETGVASKNPSAVKRLIFCSGKVYYDLVKERATLKEDDQVAIARLEQICPFPYDLVQKETAKYPNAELVWAQEEHKNMGAWLYVHPRISTLLKNDRNVRYAGRSPSASPATGNKFQHMTEQRKLMVDALSFN